MKRVVKKLATVLVLVTLLTVMLTAAEENKQSQPAADSMSLWQARRAIVAGTEHLAGHSKIASNSFCFNPSSFEFGASSKNGTQHYTVDLRTLPAVFLKCNSEGRKVIACFLANNSGKMLPPPLDLVWHDGAVFTASCPAECVSTAQSFAAAVNRLRAFTNSANTTFQQQAATWRALPSKPPLPENVRSQRLLAEDALKEKRLQEALNHYETGLDLYPTWPQGYFNAALIAAELHFYAEAIEHMQAYLQLVPDAPDAQSARDQIVIWRDKAKQ
jgi:hypothetical protein